MNIENRIAQIEGKLGVNDGEGIRIEFSEEEVEFLKKAIQAFDEMFPDRKPIDWLDVKKDKSKLPPSFMEWADKMALKAQGPDNVIDLDLQRRGWVLTKNAGQIVGFFATHPDLIKKVCKVPYLSLLAALANRESTGALEGRS